MDFSQFTFSSSPKAEQLKENKINDKSKDDNKKSFLVEGQAHLQKIYQGCAECRGDRIHIVDKDIIRCITCGYEYKIEFTRKKPVVDFSKAKTGTQLPIKVYFKVVEN